MPGNDLWLEYNSDRQFSRAGLTSLLNRAQQSVKVTIGVGFGDARIRDGHHRAGLVIYTRHGFGMQIQDAPRYGSEITWNMLFVIVDVIRYCGVDKDEYTGMQGLIKRDAATVGELSMFYAR